MFVLDTNETEVVVIQRSPIHPSTIIIIIIIIHQSSHVYKNCCVQFGHLFIISLVIKYYYVEAVEALGLNRTVRAAWNEQ